MSLIKKNKGDKVYVDCLSSFGASRCGYSKITKIDIRYDEITGKKYKRIHVGEQIFDSRDGAQINGRGMFYIE